MKLLLLVILLGESSFALNAAELMRQKLNEARILSKDNDTEFFKLIKSLDPALFKAENIDKDNFDILKDLKRKDAYTACQNIIALAKSKSDDYRGRIIFDALPNVASIRQKLALIVSDSLIGHLKGDFFGWQIREYQKLVVPLYDTRNFLSNYDKYIGDLLHKKNILGALELCPRGTLTNISNFITYMYLSGIVARKPIKISEKYEINQNSLDEFYQAKMDDKARSRLLDQLVNETAKLHPSRTIRFI